MCPCRRDCSSSHRQAQARASETPLGAPTLSLPKGLTGPETDGSGKRVGKRVCENLPAATQRSTCRANSSQRASSEQGMCAFAMHASAVGKSTTEAH